MGEVVTLINSETPNLPIAKATGAFGLSAHQNQAAHVFVGMLSTSVKFTSEPFDDWKQLFETTYLWRTG